MPKAVKKLKQVEKRFDSFAEKTSRIVGSPVWFMFSVTVVVIWIPSKFLFESEELWHLFINTFTTILTFLMMALLHSSQSRWERKIENIQNRQDRTLKIVNKDTAEIKTEIKEKNGDGNSNSPNTASDDSPDKDGITITSLF